MSSPSSSVIRVGRRVFPSPQTEAIRNSVELLHYSPPPEPPIDYTIRQPSKESSYKVVTDVFRKSDSPDFTSEENHLRSSNTKRITRRDTVEEVLDELDTVLFEASIPFEQLRQKVERFNLTFKPYAPDVNVDQLPEIPYSKQYQPVPRLEKTRESRDTERIDKIELSKEQQSRIDEVYKSTLRAIEEAKDHFTPEYFRKHLETNPAVPKWKVKLLAEKKSKQTIQRIEHDAWEDFERFKQKLEKNDDGNRRVKRSSSVQIASRRRMNE
ncbi:unnamed protein product [Caenorhabditis bovis]|uniref:Uncharacterized protein n=1 Tax=Caenorhabditis bovis TaxID=2654633 RepID=A0A8S1FBD4_9PELO|nr:unnamed protein product [Caenorhabditis bovis]